MKMIKVTNIDESIFININQIEAIYPYKDSSLITTINNNEYSCIETPEEIYQKIKEIEND